MKLFKFNKVEAKNVDVSTLITRERPKIKLLRTVVPDDHDYGDWVLDKIAPWNETDIVRELNFLNSIEYKYAKV